MPRAERDLSLKRYEFDMMEGLADRNCNEAPSFSPRVLAERSLMKMESSVNRVLY
jgi:hypothetical protein